MRNPPLPLPVHEPSCGLLRSLGLIGFERIEPIILAALATEMPILLIGSHGTAKTPTLERLCLALGFRGGISCTRNCNANAN
jgi:MoxR-like ATPase